MAKKDFFMPRFSDDFESDSFNFEDSAALENSLSRLIRHDPGIAAALKEEIEKAANFPEDNVLIVGTDGDYTITIIHVPESVIGDATGPVIMPSSDYRKVLAAVSRETIQRRADQCMGMVDPVLAQQKWESMVSWFFDKTLELIYDGSAQFVPDELPDFE